MVGELITKFPRCSGDLSSLKKFTQTAKVCALSLGRSVLGASYYVHTRIHLNELITRPTPHNCTNPLLAPVFPGFAGRDLVGGLHRQYSPVGGEL